MKLARASSLATGRSATNCTGTEPAFRGVFACVATGVEDFEGVQASDMGDSICKGVGVRDILNFGPGTSATRVGDCEGEGKSSVLTSVSLVSTSMSVVEVMMESEGIAVKVSSLVLCGTRH